MPFGIVGMLGRVAGPAARTGFRAIWPKTGGTAAKVAAGTVGAGVAADVVFNEGQSTLVPLAGGAGATVGRAGAAVGARGAAAALDEILDTALPGSDDDEGGSGGGDRTFLAMGVVLVAALLLMRK